MGVGGEECALKFFFKVLKFNCFLKFITRHKGIQMLDLSMKDYLRHTRRSQTGNSTEKASV